MKIPDVKLVKVSDDIEVVKLFKVGQVDIACAWAPDDDDCLEVISDLKCWYQLKLSQM